MSVDPFQTVDRARNSQEVQGNRGQDKGKPQKPRKMCMMAKISNTDDANIERAAFSMCLIHLLTGRCGQALDAIVASPKED